jgi:hypothetical protein
MEDKNIFETAAKKLGRQKKSTKSTPAPIQKKKRHSDPEIASMLQKIDDMKLDLQKKLDYIKNRMGWSNDQIQQFMNNPKNFPPKEWERIQQTKNALGDKVWAAIGLELKPKPRTRENIAGERKGKTLGARKKWIPMQ